MDDVKGLKHVEILHLDNSFAGNRQRSSVFDVTSQMAGAGRHEPRTFFMFKEVRTAQSGEVEIFRFEQ